MKTNIVKLLAVLAILGSLIAIAAVPASAVDAPSITLNGASSTSGVVGASVTVVASNFPTNTILVARFDGAPMTTAPTTVTTDAVAPGDATFAVLIPAATAGNHIISVTDGVNTATATFEVLQKVVITSPATKSGAVGTSIMIAGTGFSGAGVTADVVMIDTVPNPDVTKAVVSGVVVDSNGSFTATGTVPSFTSGAKVVSASDGAGNAADVTDTFTVTPTLAITPTSGLPGAIVQLTGSGWSEGSVTITFAGGTPATVSASATGAISAAYTIPTSATPGVKTVSGTQGTTSASTTFTVSPRVLTLTPSSGPMGTRVLVGGSNMTHGGWIPTNALTFNSVGWNTSGNISIDSSGTLFPTTLSVPTSLTPGTFTVVAVDNMGLSAIGQFTVTKPTMVLNPTTGAVNTSFTVTGSGWLPGTTTGSAVTITFLGVPLTTIPDGAGNIAAAITVPVTATAGPAIVHAADANGNAATDQTFTIPGALITVSPSQGAAGASVLVTGSGFAAYRAITVEIGGYKFLSQPLSDAMGAFTYTFTVPGLAPGSQAVTATDQISTASAYFVISAAGASTASQTAGISSQLVRIWGYSAGTWSMYDPADAAGSNLATLVSGNGYWVNVNAACTLIYGGYSYALSAGWNLIGWR